MATEKNSNRCSFFPCFSVASVAMTFVIFRLKKHQAAKYPA